MSCFRERKLNTINVKREGHLISKGTEVGLNIVLYCYFVSNNRCSWKFL